MEDDECPICYNEFSKTVKCVFDCKHIVCMKCNISLQEQIRFSCPICRNNISNIEFSGGAKLLIKTLTPKIIDIYVNIPYITISELKEIVAYRSGHRISDIRLVFKGRALSDNRTLLDYNAKENDIIHLVTSLRGD